MRKLLLFSVLSLIICKVEAQTCLKGDCKNGFGTMAFSAKSRYTGEFKQGQMHGRGIFYYNNGGKYIGEWHQGIREGEENGFRRMVMYILAIFVKISQ